VNEKKKKKKTLMPQEVVIESMNLVFIKFFTAIFGKSVKVIWEKRKSKQIPYFSLGWQINLA